MSRYVNYQQFEPSKVSISTVDVKTIQDGNTKINYRNVNLVYNYGTEEQPIPDELLLEFPMVKSREGIQEKTFQGKTNWTISARFEESEDNALFCEKMDYLYSCLAQALLENKSQLSFPDLRKDTITLLFKAPLYRPRDENTGELIPGRAPSCYLKLNNLTYSKTLFTDLDANPIEWKLLTGVDMEYQPLVKLPNIYVGGGKCRLQMKTISAVVAKAVASGSETLQKKTIQDLNEKMPDKVEELRKQLSKLKHRDNPLEKKEDEKREEKEDRSKERSDSGAERVKDNIGSLTSLMSGTPKKSFALPQTPKSPMITNFN